MLLPCYHDDMEQKLHPVLAIRVFREEKCFGPGIAALLKNVQEHHSLRAAAMAMGMAYSKAWTIIKTSEENLGFKLLASTTGGKNGGGATLSPEAARLLAAYDEYCTAVCKFADGEFDRIFSDILKNDT